MEQELLTLPWHLRSPKVFSGVRVTRSLVLCVCFVDRCHFVLFLLAIVLSVLVLSVLVLSVLVLSVLVLSVLVLPVLVLSVLVLSVLVLSVLLRYTDSDCTFDILKLFLL